MSSSSTSSGGGDAVPTVGCCVRGWVSRCFRVTMRGCGFVASTRGF